MKQEIIDEIIKHQTDLINILESEKNASKELADIDEEDTIDPEDLSHQVENKEMEHLLNHQLDQARQDLKAIRSLNTSPADDVRPGAMVYTEDQIFFIGVATIPFEYKGHTVVGISPGAPIYPFIKGKKAGDRITYPSKDCLIEKVE